MKRLIFAALIAAALTLGFAHTASANCLLEIDGVCVLEMN